MTQEQILSVSEYARALTGLRSSMEDIHRRAVEILSDMDKRRPLLVQIRDRTAEALAAWEQLPPIPQTTGPAESAARRRPGARHSRVKEAVANVLRAAAGPMHANEIMAAVAAGGLPLSARDPKATVVTALIRMRRDGVVRGLGGNVFEWIGGADTPNDDLVGHA